MKTRQEIITKSLVNITDIQTLLALPRSQAKKLYLVCDEIESKKEFRAHPTKVPLQLVLKKANISYTFLSKQVSNESQNCERKQEL